MRHFLATPAVAVLSALTFACGSGISDRLSNTPKWVYVAGSFTLTHGDKTWIGLARFDLDGGLDTTFPEITVNPDDVRAMAAAPDGSGVYLGGTFTSIEFGGTSRQFNGLAKITHEGKLSSLWSGGTKGFAGGAILAILASGNSLYIGGDFSQYRYDSPVTVGDLVKIDARTETIESEFLGNNQGFGGVGEVRALALDSDYLYVGGNFTANDYDAGVGGSGADTLLRVDRDSADLNQDGDFGSGTSGGSAVEALSVIGNYLYIGGDFAGGCLGSIFSNLCRADLSTAQVDELFSPTPSAPTNRILPLSEDLLYIAGSFNSVDAQDVNSLAMVTNLTTVNSFLGDDVVSPNGPLGSVYALAYHDGLLYIGGNWTYEDDTGAQSLDDFLVVNATTGRIVGGTGLQGTVNAIVLAGP